MQVLLAAQNTLLPPRSAAPRACGAGRPLSGAIAPLAGPLSSSRSAFSAGAEIAERWRVTRVTATRRAVPGVFAMGRGSKLQDAFEEEVMPPPKDDEEAVAQSHQAFKLAVAAGQKGSGKKGRRGILKENPARVAVELPIRDDKPATLARQAADFAKGLPGPVAVRFGDLSIAEAALKGVKDLEWDVDVVNPDADPIPSTTASVVICMSDNSQMDTVVNMVARAPLTAHVILLNCECTPNPPKSNTGFVSSFNVVYSYLPLNIQGLLKKREGSVLKCYTGGPMRAAQWRIWTQVESKVTCVGKMVARPGATEIENALYSAAAAENPVNKGIGFLRSKIPGQ